MPFEGNSRCLALVAPRGGARVAVATALVVASGFALQGCAKPKAPPPTGPPAVSVVTIQSQSVSLESDLPGRTSPFQVSDVRPQVNGIIQARLFEEGANVRAGQLLYRIDPAPYRATYDQAVAQLANARATLVSAKLKADRYADMVKINARTPTTPAPPRTRPRPASSSKPRPWKARASTWPIPA